MKNDNLFDTQFTFLDVVKILLLIVTMFSTWNVVDIMTPDTSFSFVRELAAVGVVEGAFLGFEMATSKAKSKRQVKFATIGFFCSLAVIGLFAGMSGILEFGGEGLLASSVGVWLGLQWFAKDVVMVAALVVLVAWIVTLAALYRLYSLNDPDKKQELEKIALNEEVTVEANKALKIALDKASPVIASARARASIKKDYAGELNLEELKNLERDISVALNMQYNIPDVAVDPAIGFVKKEASVPLAELDGEN